MIILSLQFLNTAKVKVFNDNGGNAGRVAFFTTAREKIVAATIKIRSCFIFPDIILFRQADHASLCIHPTAIQ
jgi:hypothetical protein